MTPSAVTGFDCSVCGEHHDELPMGIAFASPDFVSKLLPWDKEKRCKMSEDWAIIDDSLYYVRGCLEIPVNGSPQPFSIGVWTSLNEADFDSTMELWSDPQRVHEQPYYGMLANEVPFYNDTRLLQTKVQTRAPGERPLIYVPDKHPLGVDQRDGITRARVIEFAEMVLHAASTNPYGYLCEK
jgi:hypothetical protein